MCPACIATGAWIVAGATSTGGLTAFVLSKLQRKTQVKQDNDPEQEISL